MMSTDARVDENVKHHDIDDKEEAENTEDGEIGNIDAIPHGAADGRVKKRKIDLTEDERLEERRAANRRSALESRQRRKNLIETLQKQVEQLKKETTELRAVNDTLRLQLDSSLAENQQFRIIISQQQFASGGGAALPAFGQNAGLLLGRGTGVAGGFGALNPALAGVQQGMFGSLGGLNPALLGGLGAGFGAGAGAAAVNGAGFGAGAAFCGASELQAQLQIQQQRDVAAAMGAVPNAMPITEPSSLIPLSDKGGNNGNNASNDNDDEQGVARGNASM